VKDPKPLRWNAELTVAENCRAQLPAALRRYLEFGDELVKANVHPRELHRLRLATKHIRYSVEVFSDLFGPRIQELLKILREAQQRLGAISDATATGAWLKKQTLSRQSETLLLNEFLEARTSKQAGAFNRFWQKHFGDPAERQRWLVYLERYAGRSPVNSPRGPRRAVKPVAEEAGSSVEDTAPIELSDPADANGAQD
jgi:CHAD domain